MPTVYKVLGQSAPAANTDTTLYTVPSATQTVASTLVVCNRSSDPATYRVAVRPNGASLANEHYVAFDVLVLGNDSANLTIGLAMDAADVVTVRGSTANLSFSLYGSEIS